MSHGSGTRGRYRPRTVRCSLRRAGFVAVAAAALVGMLSGCGTPAHPAAPALISVPSTGGAAPAVLGPSDPPSTSASSAPALVHTAMKQFAPLDESGRLVVAAQQGGSGTCFSTSIAVPLSGVFRCLSDNTILDPCFAPTQETSPATVVCFADPWSDGTVMTLSKALPTYAPDLTDGNPWAIELGNGAHCVGVTGAVPVLGDVALSYRCDDGSVAGLSTADDGTMSAQYGPASGPLQDVSVITAWRGRSYRLG